MRGEAEPFEVFTGTFVCHLFALIVVLITSYFTVDHDDPDLVS
jgi:hypothetical protein